MTIGSECHYEVLGLQYTATQKDIRAAYHKQSMKWHPDKNMTNPEPAKRQFQKIQAAYECLSNPTAKALYDLDRFAERERDRAAKEKREREETLRKEREQRAAREREEKIKEERERHLREQELREQIAREQAAREQAALEEALRRAYEETEARVQMEAEVLRRQLASPFACSLDDFSKKIRGMRLDEMWEIHKTWNTHTWYPLLKTEKELKKAVPRLAKLRTDLDYELQLKTYAEGNISETRARIDDLTAIGTEQIALAFNQGKLEGFQENLAKHDSKIEKLTAEIELLDNDRAEELQRQYDVERVFIALLMFREGLLIDEKLRAVEIADTKIQELENLGIDCAIFSSEVHGCFNVLAIDRDESDFVNKNFYKGECDKCVSRDQIKCEQCSSPTRLIAPCTHCGLRMRGCTVCPYQKHIPWATRLCSQCKTNNGNRKPSLIPFGSAWNNKRELYDSKILVF